MWGLGSNPGAGKTLALSASTENLPSICPAQVWLQTSRYCPLRDRLEVTKTTNMVT